MLSREEIQSVAHENDNLNEQLSATQKDRDTVRSQKLYMEKILARAAEALRAALRVRGFWVHSKLKVGDSSVMPHLLVMGFWVHSKLKLGDSSGMLQPSISLWFHSNIFLCEQF